MGLPGCCFCRMSMSMSMSMTMSTLTFCPPTVHIPLTNLPTRSVFSVTSPAKFPKPCPDDATVQCRTLHYHVLIISTHTPFSSPLHVPPKQCSHLRLHDFRRPSPPCSVYRFRSTSSSHRAHLYPRVFSPTTSPTQQFHKSDLE